MNAYKSTSSSSYKNGLSDDEKEFIRKGIELIPGDLNNKDEVDELYRQRLQCGWGESDIPKSLKACNEGKKTLLWITLREEKFSNYYKDVDEDDNGRKDSLRTFTLTYAPPASTSALDTKNSDTGSSEPIKYLVNSLRSSQYLLVGHTSLQLPSVGGLTGDTHPDDGTVLEIKDLYIELKWRRFGLANWVMGLVERMEVPQSKSNSKPSSRLPLVDTTALQIGTLKLSNPSGCRSLILDTLHRRYFDGSDTDPNERGLWTLVLGQSSDSVPPRGRSNEDWYVRRGWKYYKPGKEEGKEGERTDYDGIELAGQKVWVAASFLRWEIGQKGRDLERT